MKVVNVLEFVSKSEERNEYFFKDENEATYIIRPSRNIEEAEVKKLNELIVGKKYEISGAVFNDAGKSIIYVYRINESQPQSQVQVDNFIQSQPDKKIQTQMTYTSGRIDEIKVKAELDKEINREKSEDMRKLNAANNAKDITTAIINKLGSTNVEDMIKIVNDVFPKVYNIIMKTTETEMEMEKQQTIEKTKNIQQPTVFNKK